jgi:predicted kinase
VRERPPARLVLLCGLPASGKSTLARELARTMPAVRLNKDDWVTRLGHDVWDDAFRIRIEAQLWDLARDLLAQGTSVILEWGHWARAERDAKRLGARALGAEVELHYLELGFEELMTRIERRQARGDWTAKPITRRDMEQWATMLEPPSDEERALFDAPLSAATRLASSTGCLPNDR